MSTQNSSNLHKIETDLFFLYSQSASFPCQIMGGKGVLMNFIPTYGLHFIMYSIYSHLFAGYPHLLSGILCLLQLLKAMLLFDSLKSWWPAACVAASLQLFILRH